MKKARERICYNALMSVYRDGAYSSRALSDALKEDRNGFEFVTRLFYGVLEKDVTLAYIIGRLVDKRPKLSVSVILKMGIYMSRFMSVPDYAAVDECVKLAKALGKGGVSDFVNAVLRKAKDIKFPVKGETSDVDYISTNYGLPEWLAEKLISQYGADFTENMMKTEEFRTHIRLRKGVDVAEFEKNISELQKLPQSKTRFGYYVTHKTLNFLQKQCGLRQGDFAVQSLASIIAARCYCDGLTSDSKVLDLCAAPGGKSVYIAETVGCGICACDIHPHRLELIRSYAERMKVNVNTKLNDACVECNEWLDYFDCVICDVPCSGTGDLRSKPDILLKKSGEKVLELSKLQSKILHRASSYVRSGGRLCYSTCSVLREENEDVVKSFLEHNADFVLEDSSRFADDLCKVSADLGLNGCLKLFPHTHNTDGFFVAVMKRV